MSSRAGNTAQQGDSNAHLTPEPTPGHVEAPRNERLSALDPATTIQPRPPSRPASPSPRTRARQRLSGVATISTQYRSPESDNGLKRPLDAEKKPQRQEARTAGRLSGMRAGRGDRRVSPQLGKSRGLRRKSRRRAIRKRRHRQAIRRLDSRRVGSPARSSTRRPCAWSRKLCQEIGSFRPQRDAEPREEARVRTSSGTWQPDTPEAKLGNVKGKKRKVSVTRAAIRDPRRWTRCKLG